MNGPASTLTAALAAGFAAALLTVRIFNVVPAKWLCDYGETPAPEAERRAAPRQIPLLGILFGLAFFLVYLQYGLSPSFFLGSAACLPLMLSALADRKYGILPDQFLLFLAGIAIAGILIQLSQGEGLRAVFPPLFGAFAGAGLWLLVGWLGTLRYHRETVGLGDVKLSAALGSLCGFPLIFAVFVLTVLFAGFHFSILILQKKIGRESCRPLGPYLCAAGFAVLAFRSQIVETVRWYCSLF